MSPQILAMLIYTDFDHFICSQFLWLEFNTDCFQIIYRINSHSNAWAGNSVAQSATSKAKWPACPPSSRGILSILRMLGPGCVKIVGRKITKIRLTNLVISILATNRATWSIERNESPQISPLLIYNDFDHFIRSIWLMFHVSTDCFQMICVTYDY